MTSRIIRYALLTMLLVYLAGCSNNENNQKNTTSESKTTITSSSNSKKQPYNLVAPNNFYNNLIVTGAEGSNYLNKNGYQLASKNDSSNSEKLYISEISDKLPNANNALGTQTYMYFWCNDTAKQNLGNVRIDNKVVFFAATEEYLNTIKENLSVNESSKDLDIEAINNGDLTTLIGTWQNGNGDTLIINADGTTNNSYSVYPVKDSDKTSKIPYAGLQDSSGIGGMALGLFKIGFKNPDGDNSDTSKPRLVISQQGGDYPSESYYYRH